MPLNAQLLSALNDKKLAKNPKALAALNAILKVDPAQPDAFRTAILAHQNVWNGLGMPAFNATGQNNDDNFLDSNPATNFPALFKAAALQRMKLGLATLNEPGFSTIIEGTKSDIRGRLVGNDGQIQLARPTEKIHGWQGNGANILDDAAMGEIQLEAQRLLLSRKISVTTDKNLIDNLLNAGDDPSFRAAAVALGVPAPTAQHMNHGQLRDLIKVEAAKKGYELDLAQAPLVDLNNAYANLRKNNVQFKADVVPAPYAREITTDEDINWVREIYGKKYLEQYYSTHTDLAELNAIASQPDVNASKALLKVDNTDNPYLDAAVTAKNLPSLRQVAAVQALSLKISALDDLNTLNAITKLTRAQDIKRLLATSDVLGYKNEHNFQEAFIDDASVKQIVAAASVRQTLLKTNDYNKLQTLLLDTNPNFADVWKTFTGATDVSNEVKNYFKNPDNVERVKKQALEAFVKLRVKSDDASVTNAIVSITAKPTKKKALIQGVNTLLGKTPSPTDSLLDNDENFRHKLRAYAAIEATLRVTKEINLTGGNLAAFKGQINNLNIQRPTAPGVAGAAPNLNGNDLRALDVANLIQVLPVKEREEFRGRLVENLINNHPPLASAQEKQNFKNLIEAKDFVQFKQALNALGITSNDWVTKESMVAVQTAASKKLIAANFANYSVFAKHDALLKVVENLPVAKQKGIVENPDVIRSLMDARTPDQIKLVVGNDVKVENNLLNNLAEENNHHANAAKIVNAEVAKLVGDLKTPPAFPLDENKVNAINARLMANPPPLNTDFAGTINGIAADLGMHDGSLNGSFNPRTVRIKSQETHNQHLLAEFNKSSIGFNFDSGQISEARKAVVGLMMSLTKQSQFPQLAPGTQNQFNDLYKDFKDSSSAAEFIDKLSKNAQLAGVFNEEDLKKQITPEVFNAAKANVDKKALLHYNERFLTGRLQELKNERKPLEDLHKEITSSDKKIHKQLKQLSETRAIEWLNPGFQSSARQNAREMLETYKELDQVCETTVRFYEKEIALLNKQLRALPKDEELPTAPGERWRKTKIAAYRAELNKQLQATETELERYLGVQRLLRGNPDALDGTNPLVKQGILKTLEAARKGEDIKFLSFESTYTDHPAEQKRSLLGNTGQQPPSVVVSGQIAGGGKSFVNVEPIPKGHLRNHVITVDNAGVEVVGRILEERGADNVETTKDGKVKYSPNYKITLAELPQGPQNQLARNQIYMAMAMTALKNGPPTKPIYINKANAETTKGIYMALMVIAHNDPNMKFDPKLIKVNTAVFDPSQHEHWGIKGKSIIYNPEYKALVKAYQPNLDAMKDLSKTMLGKETMEAKKTTDSAAKAATQHYRQDIYKEREKRTKDAIDKAEKDVSTLGNVKGP